MSLRDGVLNEDIGHPAYKPDKDMVDELRAVINRHSSRLTIGNQFGSLLVALRLVLWAQSTAPQPTTSQLHQLMLLLTSYLVRRPKQAEDPSLIIRRPM